MHGSPKPYRILQGDFLAATTAGYRPGFQPSTIERPWWRCRRTCSQVTPVHLLSLLPAGAAGLVNCFEYPPEDMQGPPFSISETRLRELLGTKCRLKRLSRREIETKGTALEGRGLDTVSETAYWVQVAA